MISTQCYQINKGYVSNYPVKNIMLIITIMVHGPNSAI